MSAIGPGDAAAAGAAAAAAAAEYPPPLDRLLTLAPLDFRAREHLDYRAMGIGGADVDGLIRMATDDRLLYAPSDSTHAWAPVHAWRALGRLRAAAAVEPLLKLVDRLKDDDWIGEELPPVFGAIGEGALAPLAAYLANGLGRLWGRVTAATALREIAVQHPHLRQAVVPVLVAHLRRADRHAEILNGYVVAALMDMGAAEAAPEMEAAFAAGHVDITAVGDWEDVQVHMGLLAGRTTPSPTLYSGPRPHLGDVTAPPARTGAGCAGGRSQAEP